LLDVVAWEISMAFGYEYWIVYLPEFNLDSFLLFVHNPAGSTKLRDSGGRERVLGQPRLGDVRQATESGRTRFVETPYPVSGRDGEWHWQSRIAGYNKRYLKLVRRTDRPEAGSEVVPAIRKLFKSIAGRARRGSQRQLQDYVNANQPALDEAIISALPARIQENSPRIKWVSPLASNGFLEYRDKEFLSVLGHDHLVKDLARFWPQLGPSWDALGILTTSLPDSLPISVVVEAKSHVQELYGNGCQAGATSRELIEKSLNAAKKWCGAREQADWMGRLYQSANRLAHLYFLREIARRPAWLVNLCFLDDPIAPTNRDNWALALSEIKTELGLSQSPPGMIEIFLPALKNADEVLDQASEGSEQLLTEDATGAECAQTTRFGMQTAGVVREGNEAVPRGQMTNCEPFIEWRRRWSELAAYDGASVPDARKRIDDLISLWREPVPGEWQRGIDPQLLCARYRRRDLDAPHDGEHLIEYEILHAQFDRAKCFGRRIVDGLNAFPLCRDTSGIGRRGNVEADLLLLVESDSTFHLYLCEVKDQSNDPWYASVESLRQLRLFVESPEARQIFAHRGQIAPLPQEIAVTALVLAPESFYTARGKKRNAVAPACDLISRFRSELDVDLRLSVWDSAESAIRPFSF
jgi:hypothetical protein